MYYVLLVVDDSTQPSDYSAQPSFRSLLQDVGLGQVKQRQVGPESLSQSFLLSFCWATVCKRVHLMLSDCCFVCL